MAAATFQLTDLCINCIIADAAVMAPLCAALNSNSITRLEIAHTPVFADAGLAEMCCGALQRLGSVRVLKLSWCGPMGPHVADMLAGAVVAMPLTLLKFSSRTADKLRAVTDAKSSKHAANAQLAMPEAVADSLTKCPNLQHVAASVNNITTLQRLLGAAGKSARQSE